MGVDVENMEHGSADVNFALAVVNHVPVAELLGWMNVDGENVARPVLQPASSNA
ncbi:MAG: hypothetical protein J4F49_03860 [Rhodobacteraceae bacterium]|nr:hypothetical protein [Paracoccaceae bacterium]